MIDNDLVKITEVCQSYPTHQIGDRLSILKDRRINPNLSNDLSVPRKSDRGVLFFLFLSSKA